VSIIERIDTCRTGVEMIPLQHASAAEVAHLTTRDGKAGSEGDAPKVFADDARTDPALRRQSGACAACADYASGHADQRR
jgi:hypothetical protein